MAIRVEIIAWLDERRLRKETDKLGDQLATSFDKAGTASSEAFTDKLVAGLAARSPRVQKAMTALANASSAVTAQDAAYRKTMADSELSARTYAGAVDGVTAAKNRELNASAAITEAEYRYGKALKSSRTDAEYLVILEERVETAKRNHANASDSVVAAELAESRAKVAHTGNIDRQTVSYNNLTNAHRRYADQNRSFAGEIRKANADMKEAESVMGNMTDSLQTLGTSAFRTGRGMAYIAAPAVIAALYETAQVAVTASQSIALLPAVAVAAGAGLGTLAMATQGFGQALKDIHDIKKFREDVAALSPNAQSAAMAIRGLLPELDGLQTATQDAFFAGFDQKIQDLAGTFLPGVQNLTTSIATSLNQSLSGVFDTFMSPGGQSQIAGIMSDIGAAFQAAAPAAKSFAQAFLDLTSVGASFLPGLAESISVVASEFATFIHDAKESGQLKTWIQQGIDAAKALGSAILEVGKFIYDVFGGAGQGEIKQWGDAVTNTLDILDGIFTTINIAMAVFNTNVMDSGKSLFELVNPLLIIRDLVNAMRWFFDPNYRAQDSALSKATQQLNDARARRGEPPVDNQGNVVPGGGTSPFGGGGGGGYNSVGPHGAPGSPNNSTLPIPMPGRGAVAGRGLSAFLGRNDVMDKSSGWGSGGMFYNPTANLPKGKDAKGQDWSAPSDQWSLGNIPIGSFPGVGAPAGMPATPLPGMPGGPPIQQVGPVDPQAAWDAQSRLQSAGFRVEETRQKYLKLAHDNTTSETDLLKAKNDVAESERDFVSAQMKAADTLKGKYDGLASGLGDIGAALDKDLGISKGLPGIADNLVRFLASLAAAPLLGKLSADVANDPHKGGYGLMGILGAQGAFGPAFTGLDKNATDTTGLAGGIPGMAQSAVSGAAGSPLPGESARDFAHRVMEPMWQSQGFTVGDHAADSHGEHQNGALDIMVNSIAEGQKVLQQVLSDPNVKGAIFNNQTYGYGHGTTPQPYNSTGSPTAKHEDHVHAWYQPGDPGDITPLPGGMPATAGSTASFAGSSIPIPLPVTIVGGGGGAIVPGGAGASAGAPGANTGGGGTGPQPGTPGGSLNWDALAAKEASGNWANKENSKYMGGLQFDQPTWDSSKPVGAPPNAADATRDQQIAAATKAIQDRGGGPAAMKSLWPENYSQLLIPRGGTAGPMPMSPVNPFGPPGLPPVSGSAWMNNQAGIPLGAPLAQGPGPYQPNIGPPPLQPGSPYIGAPDFTGVTSAAPAGGGPGAPPGIGPFGVPPSVAATQGGLGATGQTGLGMPGTTPGASGWGPGAGPTQIGGLAPNGSIAPGQGIGMTPGGTLDTAISMAASGLDLIAPGAGQAAQTGIKLANRAIQYGGQLAGIGVQGLMETFLPTGGSELANSGWAPRLVGAIAGATPALPNIAGGKGGAPAPPPLTPDQAKQQQGQTAPPGQGPNINVEYNNNGATEDRAGADLTHHLSNMKTLPGNPSKPGGV